MDESIEFDKEKNKDLPVIYKIFKEIHSKAPPFLKDLSQDSVDIDYKEFVEDSIDFKKIEQKFQKEKYCSVTDAIKDIRLVFLNCYKFYGTKSDHTLLSLKLEELLECKIRDLNEEFKSLADIQLTLDLLNLEKNKSFEFRYPKNCYDSVLLRCVAHDRNTRLKKHYNVSSATLTNDTDNEHTLKEVCNWENEIYFNDNYRYISSMWELPEIGNFVAILFKQRNLDIINQGVIERMFLMPKESTTMSLIMTVLLTPFAKTKFSAQVMPYKIWSDKLSKNVSSWYKEYYKKKQNKVSVMESLGIHPDFWAIVGYKNPLVDSDYCQLSYFMKVWLVKGLCDYIISKYKSINDLISNCNERQNTIWKNDMETEEYFYFNSMPDFRIYYYNIPYDEPSLEFLELEKTDDEIKEDDALSISSVPNIFHKKSGIKPNENNFKLIADSVDGLRSFVGELDTKDSCVPEDLISALEDFIIKIEPQEYNLIVLNNHSKKKLLNDWKSYQDKMKEDKDAISIWKEKKLKPFVANEEIILEKNISKTVFKPDFEFDIKSESEENLFETDEDSIDEFTNSDDEWIDMNQPKNKARSSVQAPSKITELKHRLRDDSKLSKQCHKKKANIIETEKNSCGLDKVEEIIKTNVQDDNSKNKSAELNLNKNVKMVSIKDDEQIVKSDDDDIQLIWISPKPQVYPVNSNRCHAVNKNLNLSFNRISRNNQVATTYTDGQVESTSIPKLSSNISIIPANIHIPNGIEVTMVKKSQPSISSHFNVTKRSSNGSSSTISTKQPSFVNVQCTIISKPNFNGEVKFFVKLPNGSLHPVSDELMNQYLKEYNSLPDSWLVPLPEEVAKQYGFK